MKLLCVLVLSCVSPSSLLEWGGLAKDLQSEIEYVEALTHLSNRSGVFDPLVALTEVAEDAKLFQDTKDKNTVIEMKILKVAFFLRFHKFSILDPRKKESFLETLRDKRLYQSFPNRKIKLDSSVATMCKRSFISCLFQIDQLTNETVIDVTFDKPTIDMVGHKYCGKKGDEKFFCPASSDKKTRLSSASYCKDKHLEDSASWPDVEKFRFITTALYFMCWYTLQKVPYLAHIPQCDSRFHCDHPEDTDGDIRANAMVSFACALHSFCPDPCCRLAVSREKRVCENLPSNPCRLNNPSNKRQCKININGNEDFNRLIQNRINLTCICHNPGETYCVVAKECVDKDECVENSESCDPITEECFNTRGGYICICKWGYHYDPKLEKCVFRPSIEISRMHHLQKLNYDSSNLRVTNNMYNTNALHKEYDSIAQRTFQLAVFGVQKVVQFVYTLKAWFNIMLTELALAVQKTADILKWELRSDTEIKLMKKHNVENILLIKLDAAAIFANLTEERRLEVNDND